MNHIENEFFYYLQIEFTDMVGVISYCNQNKDLIFGYKKKELLNKKFQILLPGLLRKQHKKVMHRSFSNSQNQNSNHIPYVVFQNKDDTLCFGELK